MIKLKLSSQLIGQFGHVTASASCKQPEKHGNPTVHSGGQSSKVIKYLNSDFKGGLQASWLGTCYLHKITVFQSAHGSLA